MDNEYIRFDPGYILAFKLSAGLVCLLSIGGSTLVILTYALFKNLRTVARQLLVNLSVADIIANSSHIFGMAANLSRSRNATKDNPHLKVAAACSIQGGITVFATVACFLWTIALALHLFALIAVRRSKVRKGLVIVFYFICWGLPLTLSITYASRGFLGYEEFSHVGWCYVSSNSTHRWIGIVGYDVWMCLVVLTLLILFLATKCYLKIKLSGPRSHMYQNLKTAAKATGLKLAAVWITFLLMRIWSFVLHISPWLIPRNSPPPVSLSVVVFFAGIGNSSQGLVNAFLFCLLTRTARQRLWAALKSCCHWKTEEGRPMIMLSSTTVSGDEHSSFYRSEETERLLNVPAPVLLT